MTYVMSDIHGEYEKYKAMLENIGFCEDDTLYILGDVVDRGPEPVKLLQDMMARDNVYPVMGNHEYFALYILEKLLVEITEDNYASHIDSDLMNILTQWQLDGGSITMEKFKELSGEERMDIMDYLSDFPLFETLDVDDKSFILVHSGLGNFSPDKKLTEYSINELAFSRTDFSKKYFDDDSVFIISGHTPTLSINGKAEIYKENNNICIDCGACFESGRLACLCLETMEEFYI